MSAPPKRPASVTWLAAIVFLLALTHLGSVPYALTRWNVRATLNTSFPMWIRIGLSGLWGGMWLALAGGLWSLRRWGRRLTLFLAPAYAVYMIGWDLIFVRGTYERGQVGCAALLALAGTGCVSIILTRPRVRRAFENKRRDREQRHDD